MQPFTAPFYDKKEFANVSKRFHISTHSTPRNRRWKCPSFGKSASAQARQLFSLPVAPTVSARSICAGRPGKLPSAPADDRAASERTGPE